MALAVSFISMIISDDRAMAFRVWFRWCVEAGMLFFSISLLGRKNIGGVFARAALWLMVVCVAVEAGRIMKVGAIISFSRLFRDYVLFGMDYPRAFGIFEIPTVAGSVSVFCIMLSIHVMNRRVVHYFEGAVMLVCSVVIFAMSASLNSWFILALAAVVSVTGMYLLGYRKSIALPALCIAVFLASVYWLHPDTHRRVNNLVKMLLENSFAAASNSRTLIWKAALRAWLENPWLGLGPNVFSMHVGDYLLEDSNLTDGLNAHNGFLGVLSETGLLGFTAMSVLLYKVFKPLFDFTRGGHRVWVGAWTAALIGSQVFDFNFYSYRFVMFCVIIVGFLYGQYLPEAAPVEAAPVESMDTLRAVK
jgi:O-antigen ligase